jgi:hypothetical protein
VADLVAHPIGRRVINPDQLNRACNILEQEFQRRTDGSGRPGRLAVGWPASLDILFGVR